MPTYDYVCQKCDHAFEHFQSMREKHLRKCPACGKPGLERLIGKGSGIVFKGSGFYETDYKRAPPPSASKGDGKPTPSGSGKADAGKSGGDKPDGEAKPPSADKAPDKSDDGSVGKGASGGSGKSPKPGGDSADK